MLIILKLVCALPDPAHTIAGDHSPDFNVHLIHSILDCHSYPHLSILGTSRQAPGLTELRVYLGSQVKNQRPWAANAMRT